MPFAAPQLTEMFPDCSPSERVERFDRYKSVLADVRPQSPEQFEARKVGATAADTAKIDQVIASMEATLAEKSVSADVLGSIGQSLDAMKAVRGDLVKDWSSASPLASGYVAYDLQAPAKEMWPRETILRNDLPRTQGVGKASLYKQVTGTTNAGVGGVADATPFFNSESATTTFGSLSLRRPTKISYAGADQSVIYKEQGFSDSVTFLADWQSLGYQNMRQLSQTAALWALLLGEEKSLLYGRGSSTGFAGAIAAPTGVTFAANSALANPVTGQSPTTVVGNTANVATIYVYVTASSGRGQSVASTVASSTTFAATTGKTSIVTWTGSTGALGYTIYAGTTTGIANAFYMGTSQSTTFSLSFGGAGTGGVPSTGTQPSASDTSADVNAYDGMLTILTNPALAGYVNAAGGQGTGGVFSTTNPGVEYQTAFENMYYNGGGTGQTALANPDVIYMYAGGRVALSDLLKQAGANYRLTIDQADVASGVTLGSLITAIQNEITGKVLPLTVLPYMPKGCSIIYSKTIPVPQSEIPSAAEVRNVIDYTAIQWADIQMTHDISNYMLGSLIFYAPLWSGAITNIAN